MTELLVPAALGLLSLLCLAKKKSVYSVLAEGAAEGIKTVLAIIPPLAVLLTAVSMFRASGAMDLLTNWVSPFANAAGIPPEVLPLVLVRPLSGSAALGVFADLLSQYGADSLIGRTAAVMMGSTETTFYTVCVYFGAAKIKKTRYAIPAALVADLTGFIVASLISRLFWS